MVASKADVDCANTTATQTRMEDVDFSSLIFLDGGAFRQGHHPSEVRRLRRQEHRRDRSTTTEARLDAALKQAWSTRTSPRVKDATKASPCSSRARSRLRERQDQAHGLAVQARDPSRRHPRDDLSIEPWLLPCRARRFGDATGGQPSVDASVHRRQHETIFNQWLGALGRPSGLLASMYLLNVFQNSKVARRHAYNACAADLPRYSYAPHHRAHAPISVDLPC